MAISSSPMKSPEGKGSDFLDKAKNTAADAVEKVKDTAASKFDKAKDTAGNLVDKAKDTAGNLVDKAKDTAGNFMDKAKDTACDLGKRADDATHAVGSGMQSLAGTLRDNMPKEGVIGAASSSVARGLEASGDYLQKEGLGNIAEDMTNLIRRNPIPAILLGIGLGFVLARATSSRS